MSNPVRLGRYMYDFASTKERLIFTRSKDRPWRGKPLILPLILLALVLYYIL
jgi:hypothetical protein